MTPSHSLTDDRRLSRLVAVVLSSCLALIAVGITPAHAANDLSSLSEQLFHQRHLDARDAPSASGISDYSQTGSIDGRTDLLETARAWSKQMAEAGQLRHNPGLAEAICCWSRVGENVGVFRGSVATEDQVRAATEHLMQAWVDSDGHRKNIMDPKWDQFAVGVVIVDGAIWATTLFRTVAVGETPPGSAYGPQGSSGTGRQSTATQAPDKPSPTARDTSSTCADVSHPGFADSNGTVHGDAVRCASEHGLAKGRSSSSYEPNGSVTRGQVMSFVRRAVEASGRVLDPNAPDAFTDDDGTTHEQSTNMLVEAGFVGLEGDHFRANESASRGFIASVVGRTMRQLAGATTEVDYFTDDEGHVDEAWINLVAAYGIATGNGDSTFEPDAALTRGQIATILVRAFDALSA